VLLTSTTRIQPSAATDSCARIVVVKKKGQMVELGRIKVKGMLVLDKKTAADT
jgi:hypothetical protein